MRLVQIFGGMSLVVLVWFCMHAVFPGWLDDFDLDAAHNGVGVVFVAFVVSGVICSFFYFDARAILGYVAALIIILVAVRASAAVIPPFREYQHGYARVAMLVLVPLGNVLNLFWFLDRRFRLVSA
ncbi:MAG: hypothetical protein JWN49_157 [Parcubacteria group bacterium]|nr:hypothetical protein [Parcubacteria group bacterium]